MLNPRLRSLTPSGVSIPIGWSLLVARRITKALQEPSRSVGATRDAPGVQGTRIDPNREKELSLGGRTGQLATTDGSGGVSEDVACPASLDSRMILGWLGSQLGRASQNALSRSELDDWGSVPVFGADLLDHGSHLDARCRSST